MSTQPTQDRPRDHARPGKPVLGQTAIRNVSSAGPGTVPLEVVPGPAISERYRRIASAAVIMLGVGGVAALGSPMPSVAAAIPVSRAAMLSCVTPPTALLPCDTAIPGFTGRRVLARSVLAVAPRQAVSVLRSAPGDAADFAWTAANGHGNLVVVAWHLTDSRTANGALSTWRAAVAKRHPVSLKLADGAFLLRSGGAKAPALAVVRVGPVVAALRFETSARGKPIDDFLTGEAGTETGQISRVLSQTGFELLSYEVYQHDGLTPGLALQAFALIGGQGPGVPKPVPHAGFIDGTAALDWVLAELPRFSKPQRRAVQSYLARTFPQHASGSIMASRRAHLSGATTAADYQAIADQMLARIETHTGPLGITPVVVKDTTSTPGEYALTNVFLGCRITVYQTNDAQPLSFKEHTLAHELGHCMQLKYGGVRLATHLGNVGWLLEGLPEWIADEVVPLIPSESPIAFSNLTLWDGDPGVPLTLDFALGYGAVGFFGHVADVVGDNALWNRIPQIMAANDTPSGLAATVQSNAQEIYDTWGGSYAQRPDVGPRWMRINPYPAAQTTLGEQIIQHDAKHVIVPDGSVPLASEPASGNLYQVSTDQPFLRILPQGKVFGRVADMAGKDLQIEQTAGHLYCTTGNCTQCPPGTEGTPPPSEPLTMPLLVGLSGGTPPPTSGDALITGEPWSKYCRPTTTSLLVPCNSIGPVHLGEAEADVDLGPSRRTTPLSVNYPDYSITVAYLQGKVASILLDVQSGHPYQYHTDTHPDVAIGVPMENVPTAYPQTQCVVDENIGVEGEDCQLRSNDGHCGTDFVGGADLGQPIPIEVIQVAVPALLPPLGIDVGPERRGKD